MSKHQFSSFDRCEEFQGITDVEIFFSKQEFAPFIESGEETQAIKLEYRYFRKPNVQKLLSVLDIFANQDKFFEILFSLLLYEIEMINAFNV